MCDISGNMCDVSGNGVIVDGTLTLWMTFLPTTLGMKFGNLAVGADTFDGTLSLTFAGTEANRTTQINFGPGLRSRRSATSVELAGMTAAIEATEPRLQLQ